MMNRFRALLCVLLLGAMGACVSPTAPTDDSPPPDDPMWGRVALMVGPLFQALPGQVAEQGSAADLRLAVTELRSAVAARDLSRMWTALARLSQARQIYAAHATFRPGDLPILATIEIFELSIARLLGEPGPHLVASARRVAGANVPAAGQQR